MLPVHFTSQCLRQLEAIQGPLTWQDADTEYHHLLVTLSDSVIPNLARFPELGQRYLDKPPQSAEALVLLRRWDAESLQRLRLYQCGTFSLLYCVHEGAVHLLSIREQARLEIDLLDFWANHAGYNIRSTS